VSPLECAIDVLAEAVARKVVAQLTAGQVGVVDQSASPLGRRRHIAAVRRLIASGAPGGAVVGRRHLLTREALNAELAAQKPRSQKVIEPPAVDPLAELREKYGHRGRA
jgi:hypothetical protein